MERAQANIETPRAERKATPDSRPAATAVGGRVRDVEQREVEGPRPWLQLAHDRRFRFETIRLPIRGLPAGMEGLRVLFVSDLHLRRVYEPVLTPFLERARAAKPELILIGGDLVEDKVDHRPALPAVRTFLRGLVSLGAAYGQYAVIGNHDGLRLPGNLAGEAVTWFMNRRVMASGPRGEIELIGMGGPRLQSTDRDTLHGPAPRTPGVPRIVVSHFPSLIRVAGQTLAPDLFLAGHTHGGQVCLPGGYPLMTHDQLPKQYAAGLHRWGGDAAGTGGTWLLVSRGLGFSHMQIRTFCPPEGHLLILHRGE